MDILGTIGAAIVGGSTLGATIAGFLAYQRSASVKVLRESNSDYEKRIEQLETERDQLKDRVRVLELEKALPLTELTQLIVKNNTDTTRQLKHIAKSMADVVDAVTRKENGK